HLLNFEVDSALDRSDANVADLILAVDHAIPLAGGAQDAKGALGVVDFSLYARTERLVGAALQSERAIGDERAAGLGIDSHARRVGKLGEQLIRVLGSDRSTVEVRDDVAGLDTGALGRAAGQHTLYSPGEVGRAGHRVWLRHRPEPRDER